MIANANVTIVCIGDTGLQEMTPTPSSSVEVTPTTPASDLDLLLYTMFAMICCISTVLMILVCVAE